MNKQGKTNCLTASSKSLCCHLQYSGENVLSSKALFGVHLCFFAVATAPVTVVQIHRS